jgi:hypothetical protein
MDPVGWFADAPSRSPHRQTSARAAIRYERHFA